MLANSPPQKQYNSVTMLTTHEESGMNARRRTLLGGSVGALLAASWPALAAVKSAAPLFVLVDIDTPGARNAYHNFQMAIERRFGANGVMPRVQFLPAPSPLDAESSGHFRQSLVELRPRIVVCANPAFALAARTFNLGVPILFFSADDPTVIGLTDSLIRPGTGMTGFTLGASSTLKRQEMLLRLVPHCRVMGQIVSSEVLDEGLQRPAAAAAHPWKHVEHRRFTCETPAELAAILRRAGARQADAWDVAYVTVPFRHAEETVRLFNLQRRPVMYPRLRHVHLGGMAAYEPRIDDVWSVWASQADSLLRGVPIADIPVVQGTRYSFGLNLKACRRVGVEPAKTLIKIADLVLE